MEDSTKSFPMADAIGLSRARCLRPEYENINRRDFLKRLAGLSATFSLILLSDAIGQEQSPNIILISIDSLRPDHLSCYGYPKATSPNIDTLANEGVLFTNSISTTTWTLTAHISMLTSLYPEVHQVIHDGNKLSEKAVICAEIMKEAGYLTAGFVSGPYLSSKFGYNQGFDLYDDYTIHYSSNEASHSGITSPKIHQRVGKWLEQNYRSGGALRPPFFLFIHYWDVHYDYNPPPPFDVMFDLDYKGTITAENYERNKRINPDMPKRDLEHIIALYDGEIAFTDSYIGKLMEYLKKLGIYDNTLIILTSDHGDEFFEHGSKGHRRNLFDETLKVPLIMKFPGGAGNGMRINQQVSIVDIVPTFLDYLGIRQNGVLQGESLLPLIAGNDEDFQRYRFADLHGFIKCIRTNQFKYIYTAPHRRAGSGFRTTTTRRFSLHRIFDAIRNNKPKSEQREKRLLFDLQHDPTEQHNLAMSNIKLRTEMHRNLMEWLNQAKILAKNVGKSDFEYDEDLKKKLKDLGYIQ